MEMAKITSLAKEYDATFNSTYWGRWFWLMILTMVLSGYFLILTYRQPSICSSETILLLISECASFYLFSKVEDEKTKRILGKYRPSLSNIDSCKRDFLKKSFGGAKTNYLSIASDIKTALDLQESLKPNTLTSLSQWRRYIYDPESKPRINAQIIMLSSMIFLLLNKESNGIANVFEFYQIMDSTIPLIALMIPAIFGLIVLAQIALSAFFLEIFPEPSSKIKYLLRDLIKFHEFNIQLGYKNQDQTGALANNPPKLKQSSRPRRCYWSPRR